MVLYSIKLWKTWLMMRSSISVESSIFNVSYLSLCDLDLPSHDWRHKVASGGQIFFEDIFGR